MLAFARDLINSDWDGPLKLAKLGAGLSDRVWGGKAES
jgi:hypothetical protein